MRLFIALPLSPAIREAALGCQDRLRAAGRANFSRPENLHVTLAFLGEVGDPSTVVGALEGIGGTAYSYTLGGLLRFGSVLCLKVEDGGHTVRLANEVRAALRTAGIAFDPKPPRPHVTLAREYAGDIPALPDTDVAGHADRFVLYRSDRVAGRLTYTPLWEKRLTE